MGILPVSTFCSGHTFFVQRMAEVMGLKPYVVHATFQFSGTPGKRHRMRESLLWTAVHTTPPPPNTRHLPLQLWPLEPIVSIAYSTA